MDLARCPTTPRECHTPAHSGLRKKLEVLGAATSTTDSGRILSWQACRTSRVGITALSCGSDSQCAGISNVGLVISTKPTGGCPRGARPLRRRQAHLSRSTARRPTSAPRSTLKVAPKRRALRPRRPVRGKSQRRPKATRSVPSCASAHSVSRSMSLVMPSLTRIRAPETMHGEDSPSILAQNSTVFHARLEDSASRSIQPDVSTARSTRWLLRRCGLS